MSGKNKWNATNEIGHIARECLKQKEMEQAVEGPSLQRWRRQTRNDQLRRPGAGPYGLYVGQQSPKLGPGCLQHWCDGWSSCQRNGTELNPIPWEYWKRAEVVIWGVFALRGCRSRGWRTKVPAGCGKDTTCTNGKDAICDQMVIPQERDPTMASTSARQKTNIIVRHIGANAVSIRAPFLWGEGH